MFLIEDKIAGCVQKFDGPLDHAINKAMASSPAVLWWIFGGRNDRICDVLPNKPRPRLNWSEVAKLGWWEGEFKCPLCGRLFNQPSPSLVAEHTHKHFAMI